jgi:hypothetical protein
MKNLLYIVLLLLPPGLAWTSDSTIRNQDDRIRVAYGEEENTGPIVIENPNYVGLFITPGHEEVTRIIVRDVSPGSHHCAGNILPSPSLIADYKVNPDAGLSRLDMRIKLPCAAYHNDFTVSVQVDTTARSYRHEEKIQVTIPRESPGYQ